MTFAAVMVLALVLDVAIGWPDALYRRIGHPVAWVGVVISMAERRLNRGSAVRRRVAGAALLLVLVGGIAFLAFGLSLTLPQGWFGVVLAGVLSWPLVAARSLFAHVSDVAAPLAANDLKAARAAVSKIVGRNPEAMDEAAIARAGLESLAENASDGVVAPLFWGALLGLPGIAAYKTINTLDSMIGYRNDRYRDFGWASARIDDAVNLIPARLTGLLIAGAAVGVRRTAFRTMRRDAQRHRSPNAGWPEAAMAGALGIRLSGPRMYDGVATDDAWLNPVAGDPRPQDMVRGLKLYSRAVALFAICLGVAALL